MSFKSILRYFFIWQVAIIFLTSGSSFRSNFDGLKYLNIASNVIGINQEIFFPLYPKLINLLHPLVINPVTSGVLISSIFFLFGLVFFTKLIKLDYKETQIKWMLISLLIFPTSFFFTSVYSEGLYFFLIISSFYFARTQRWWLSAILVALATYTRLSAILLIPALFLELQGQQPKNLTKSLLPFLLMPLGLLIYMNHLWNIKGDPLAFFRSPSTKIILPYQVSYRYLRMLTSVDTNNPIYLTLILESFVALAFIAIGIIMVFQNFRPSYTFFTLATLIVPTLTGTFSSIPRYALMCFPIFIFLGIHLQSSRKFRLVYSAICLLLSVIFISMFARGFWVA